MICRTLVKLFSIMPFYAVKCGRKPGIYQTWSECEMQIKGFHKAKFKKFGSETEAAAFVNGENVQIKVEQEENDISSTSSVRPALSRYPSAPCYPLGAKYKPANCLHTVSTIGNTGQKPKFPAAVSTLASPIKIEIDDLNTESYYPVPNSVPNKKRKVSSPEISDTEDNILLLAANAVDNDKPVDSDGPTQADRDIIVNACQMAGQLNQSANHLIETANQLRKTAVELLTHVNGLNAKFNICPNIDFNAGITNGIGPSVAKRQRQISPPTTVHSVPRRSMSTEINPEDVITVYTDGACTANGKDRAKAGIGVFWGKDHPYNVSERLPGRQTNNRAEIHAAIRAIKQAKEMNKKKLIVNTDSSFLINSITKWIKKWKKNGWILSSGEPVVNRDDFEELDAAMNGIKVEWVHVRGHSGVYGNEAADYLAVQGAKKHKYSEKTTLL